MRVLSTPGTGSLRFSHTFSALRHPNYRLWFAGQVVSLIGSWTQSTAQGYLVFELTGSPAYLGYVGFAAGVPAWLFTLYGGVVADRIPRRTMLIITQLGMMSLAIIQATLVFTGVVQPWHILVLATLLGVANAFDAPARQAFVAELVGREDLTNAIAINSAMFNTAVVVGPAAAGVIYDKLGPAWCFTVNGASYLAVISALLLMRLRHTERSVLHTSAWRELLEGFRYLKTERTTRWLIANIGMVSLLGLSMMTLIPAWAVDVLGGDVKTNSMLLSARGAGALTGALMIASLSSRGVRGRFWAMGSMMLPVMMILFSQTRWLPLSLGIMMVYGWSFMVQANSSNSLVQTKVPDQLRGRVMSIYTLVFTGLYPIGSLLAGTVAARASSPVAVMVNASVLLAFAALIWLRAPEIRRAK